MGQLHTRLNAIATRIIINPATRIITNPATRIIINPPRESTLTASGSTRQKRLPAFPQRLRSRHQPRLQSQRHHYGFPRVLSSQINQFISVDAIQLFIKPRIIAGQTNKFIISQAAQTRNQLVLFRHFHHFQQQSPSDHL